MSEFFFHRTGGIDNALFLSNRRLLVLLSTCTVPGIGLGNFYLPHLIIPTTLLGSFLFSQCYGSELQGL